MVRCQEDPHFARNEKLYRAVSPAYYHDGVISSDAITFPDCSFDRSKYGDPNSLLRRFAAWNGWGAAALRVGDLQEPINLTDGDQMEFVVKHVPSKKNMAHTEVRCFLNGSRPATAHSTLWVVAEKKYRIELANRLAIVVEPAG